MTKKVPFAQLDPTTYEMIQVPKVSGSCLSYCLQIVNQLARLFGDRKPQIALSEKWGPLNPLVNHHSRI